MPAVLRADAQSVKAESPSCSGLSRLRQPAHRGSALARSGHRLALGCRHPGVGVRTAFAAQDVVDMVRTNAGSRGC